MIDVVVGYDEREAVAYHTFCQSVISTTTLPVRFTPLLRDTLHGINARRNGSNDFVYSRFLTPYLMSYRGWAIYADGDMICRSDIGKLWDMRDDKYAVMVVKHDYKTKHPVKYLGNKNEDYPRKNWSSLILWNCAHSANRLITPNRLDGLSASFLHRFQWLHDGEIGELPITWNWLVSEYPKNEYAHLYHYTIGTPCFELSQKCDNADFWFMEYKKLNEGMNG